MPKTLFVVSTPIGNLEDMTYRAVRVLGSVDLIAAEDTRKTKILLDRYNIQTPLSSYHKFNIKGKTSYFINELLSGKDIAIVTDAGVPCISDPGSELVLDAAKHGITIVPIPGPSSVTAALSASGFLSREFIFLGFLQKKQGKQKKALKNLIDFEGTIIIFESPFRIKKTLGVILEVFGNREVVVAREITKKFEEFLRGPASDVLNKISEGTVKGEITLLVEGNKSVKKSKKEAQSGEI